MSDNKQGDPRGPARNPSAESPLEVIGNLVFVAIVGIVLLHVTIWQGFGGALLLYLAAQLFGRGYGFGYFRATMAESDEHDKWAVTQVEAALEAIGDRENAEADTTPADILAGRGDRRDD